MNVLKSFNLDGSEERLLRCDRIAESLLFGWQDRQIKKF